MNKEYQKRYYEAHKQEIMDKVAKWKSENPEKAKEYVEKSKPYQKEYQKLYRKKYCAANTGIGIARITKERLDLLNGKLMLGMSYNEIVNYLIDIVENLNRPVPTITMFGETLEGVGPEVWKRSNSINPLYTQDQWAKEWILFKKENPDLFEKSDADWDEDYQNYLNRKNMK